MRQIGLDIGKISFKAVLIVMGEIKETFRETHHGEIEKIWQELKKSWNIKEKDKIVSTGTFRKMFPFSSIPIRVAQKTALEFLYPKEEVSLISLGGSGFSVLKTRNGKQTEWWPSQRCASGTGAFLDQILTRLGTDILHVDQLVGGAEGLEITSRCGVTAKTDVTHLLNTGQLISEVSAGLIDSLAKNALNLALKSPITKKVLLIGGLSVCQRIVQTMNQNLNGAKVQIPEQALFFESLGAALIAGQGKLPKTKTKTNSSPLVYLPGLKEHLNRVTKIYPEETQISSVRDLTLGLDIGSTGAKAVVFDGKKPIFEAYCDTKGQPILAAKNLIQKVVDFLPQIKAVGCTGSGREIVGPLLKASLPEENHKQIFVLNEIAAHAQGAVYYDSEVDTVVDIGGQDSKFIQLEQGRVIDNAMNTVCSAGTGSFLAEQVEVLGIDDVKQLGQIAMDSERAVDLGQHCAIFISGQINEAKRKGANLEEIIAGLYYSIVRNYNNRVKGLRDYGKKIFLQGKPAENLALAAALARVSSQPIVVPPSPGAVGALGIALLAKKELGNLNEKPALNFENFLRAKILNKTNFKCKSKQGCNVGNQCLIDLIEVQIGNEKIKFFWGGKCDLHEKNSEKNPKLAQAPKPFLKREEMIADLIKHHSAKKTIAIPRGLELEEILPLAIVFFQELGFNVKLPLNTSLKSVEQGANLCQASFCAPLQILAGQAKNLEGEDYLFLPKVIEIPGKSEQNRCYVCPLSQATPDMFGPKLLAEVLRPFLNFKDGYQKNRKEFLKVGAQLGCSSKTTQQAFKKAVEAQEKFEQTLREIGKKALEFGQKNQIPVIAVLGHPYIINSSLLNAGIPETIEKNGAIALPADCYPFQGIGPNLNNIYWGYGHRLLDLAYEIRRQSGVFPLWLSVYSCGPDSFLIHFFQHLSQKKPYCLLESDAYTGQAGFKTRVEAFLYSIKNYQEKQKEPLANLAHFEIKQESEATLSQIKGRKVLIPWMGESSVVAAAILRAGLAIEAEHLPMANQETLEMGRQCTSGKECLPMIVTMGALLKHLENNPERKFSFFMPFGGGPCRFGQYQLLFKIILENLGLAERVNVISPGSETGYSLSQKFGAALTAKSWASFVFVDCLRQALLDVRPGEKTVGKSQQVFEDYLEKAEKMVSETPNDWSGLKNLWGMGTLAIGAAREFEKIPQTKDEKLRILLTGEIYVRLDEFSNNQTIRELEALGARVKLAPFSEWLNYIGFQRRKGLTLKKQKLRRVYLTWLIQKLIEQRIYKIFAKKMHWKANHSIDQILATAKPYLSRLQPLGETALTIGLPLLLWQKKEIDGTVLTGPFECMPTRIAETQLGPISEKTGLPVLSLSFYGDPLDKEPLESFIWNLKT